MAGRAQRSGWALLLGAALAAVAIVSLLTFSILARKTALGDAPGPGVTVAQAGPTPGTINLPSPSPTGGTDTDEPAETTELLANLPTVDGITAPRLAAVAESPEARSPKRSGGEEPKNAGKPGGGDDHKGRALAKGHHKPGGPVQASRADGGSGEREFASSPGASKKSHGGQDHHSKGKGKGHGKGRGKGHARHH